MPEGSGEHLRQRGRMTAIFGRITAFSFLACGPFTPACRVPALEIAAFLRESATACVRAVRQRRCLRLATAVLSGVFAFGVIAHGP